MRVLFLTDRVSMRGGADQHLLQVIGSIARRGAEVTVAAGHFEADAALPRGARTARLRGLASMVASGARLAGLGELLGLADLVHVQNVMNPTVLAAAVATGRALLTVQDHRLFCPGPGKTLPDGSPCLRQPTEQSCAACLTEPGYRARALALTLARRDAVRGARLLVLSRYMAHELDAVGLGGAEVLPPFVEVSSAPAEPGEGFVLGGRLVVHKGVALGLDAFARSGVEAPLRVAGEGPLAPAEGLGWLAPAELRALLRRSRALLFPSRWQEPFGILGLEALAEGTPAVVMTSGGTGEWSGRGCVRIRPGDLEAMAAAVRRLAEDPDEAMRLGEEGRAAVRERFGRREIEAQLAEVYDEVLERPRARP